MLFKLYFFFLVAGMNAVTILLANFLRTYTDASSSGIGLMLMIQPVSGLIFRPIICAKADRAQAHRKYMMASLLMTALCYMTFVILPFLGPGVYQSHSRLCWYVLVVAKILGDIALGGAECIGDTLAINYARRINNDFGVYRSCGTIAWMASGVFTGYINETQYLPRYVPALMVYVVANLLNFFFFWIWPDECFKLVHDDDENEKSQKEATVGGNKFTKSLLSREVILEHMKLKLVNIFYCSRKNGVIGRPNGDKLPRNESLAIAEVTRQPVDKLTQLKILTLLLRRDPRIIAYCMILFSSGMNMICLSFVLASISQICHQEGTCNYSELAGYMQTSMAVGEVIFFINSAKFQRVFGRVNLSVFLMFSYSVQYYYFGFWFTKLDPSYSILAGSIQGVCFAGSIVLVVELAHKFAGEVRFIVPELVDRGIIDNNIDLERLKVSLSATMQALVSGFYAGLGRGTGALIIGFLLERMSDSSAWRLVTYESATIGAIIMLLSILDSIFKFNVGLDVKKTETLDEQRAEAATRR